MKNLMGLILASTLFIIPSAFADCGSCGVGDKKTAEAGAERTSCDGECACDKNKASKSRETASTPEKAK